MSVKMSVMMMSSAHKTDCDMLSRINKSKKKVITAYMDSGQQRVSDCKIGF